MKKVIAHFLLVVWFWCGVQLTESQAFTIQGYIRNAKSPFIYLKSNWQRKDTLKLDAQGYFQANITHSPYEKVFYLSWVAKDDYGRFISLIVEPQDTIEITASGKHETMAYKTANLPLKKRLETLLQRTYSINHGKDDLKTEAAIQAATVEIFANLDTLFQLDPILGVECLGAMRRTLFRNQYSWQQLPKIRAHLEALPTEVKLQLPIYPILYQALWPGSTILELSYLDSTQVFRHTSEIQDQSILLLFGASWCGPCRQKNELIRSKFEQLRGKITVLDLSIETNYEDWKAYIKEKNYPWLQGFWTSDEQMSRDELREKYHLNFIPLSILIDQNRKIVAFNPDLETVISFAQKNH